MNKYVVAFLSLYDGELKQEIVEADSTLEAGISYLGYTENDAEGIETLDQLYERMFDQDNYMHVLDLNKALKTNWGGSGLQTRIAQFDSESRFH